MKRIFTVTLLVALMLAVDVFACTSAIFTGKATPDGRPLLGIQVSQITEYNILKGRNILSMHL